jgi:hypothetical protein
VLERGEERREKFIAGLSTRTKKMYERQVGHVLMMKS